MDRLLFLPSRIVLVFILFVAPMAVLSEPIPVGTPARPPESGTLESYHEHLFALRELVSACDQNPNACDPARVGSDDHVPSHTGAPAFDVHWSWLWDLLLKAKDPKLAQRKILLHQADERLKDQMREAGVATGVDAEGSRKSSLPDDFKRARSGTDKILAASEFRRVTGNSFRDQLTAKLVNWLNRVFGGVSTLARSAPWLGPVIMYGFLLLALAALLVWVIRVLDRQRLAVRLEPGAALAHMQETSKGWATLADAAAASGEWREAVHALYWATVSELEGRRLWRSNNVRTPREYLRLISPDAPQYRPLRALTLSLERIWYGLSPAVREDYDEALAVYEELRSA